MDQQDLAHAELMKRFDEMAEKYQATIDRQKKTITRLTSENLRLSSRVEELEAFVVALGKKLGP